MAETNLSTQQVRGQRQKSPSSSSNPHHYSNYHHHQHSRHQRQQQQEKSQCHDQQQPPDIGDERRIILIAMDGSPHSFYAFDWYMDHFHRSQNEVIVAHSCPQASTLLAHAHHLMPSVTADDRPLMNRLANDQEEEEVNQIVTRIKGRLATSGVRGKLVRLSGDPGSTIVNAAKEYKAVCIVTGSRGLGTIKRTFIGSVSDYILHHAHCPVLICRHKEIKS